MDGTDDAPHPTLPLDLPSASAPPPARKRRAQRAAASDRARVRLRWEQLGPGALETQGAAFGEWVIWLVDTYAMWDVWPSCWHQHAGLVEELTALWAWHVALDNDAGGDGDDAVSWHTAFWRFVDRSLPRVGRRCLSSHQAVTEDVVEARAQMVDTMRHTYAAAISTTVGMRRAATAGTDDTKGAGVLPPPHPAPLSQQ